MFHARIAFFTKINGPALLFFYRNPALKAPLYKRGASLAEKFFYTLGTLVNGLFLALANGLGRVSGSA